MRTTTWPAFEYSISLKEATSFYISGSRAVFQRTRMVGTRKKPHGGCFNICGSEICSKGGNFFRQIVLLYIAPKY